MHFGLLGPLTVSDGPREVAVSAPRQRVLLAALLLNAGRVVSLDALGEMLWEGESPAGSRGALHSAVQRLRSTLGPPGADLVETRPPGYLIKVGDDDLDVRQFGMLAARGHAAAEAGAWAQAAGLLREALGLWRGEPLADVPSQLLRDREVPALEDQRLQALAVRIDADLHLGRHADVTAELRQLVAAHPLQEQFHAQLMLSLYRGGRQADALAAYQRARRVVTEELGIEPSPELRLLHQRILTADDELLLAANGEPPGPESGAWPDPPVPAPGDAGLANSPPGNAGLANSGHENPGRREPAAAPERLVPRQLPVATRHFAGRDDALKTLAGLGTEAAETSSATVIVVIAGTAGIGKTTLALHFGHQAAELFPDGQLYVNLRGFDPAGPPMTSEEALRLLLGSLAVPAARIPAGLDAQAGLYRSLLAGTRTLVLLDNARDVDQVRPLLPASPGCLVIVTSRSQLTGLVATESAFPLTLDVLADADAQELLTRRLGAQRVEDDPGAADELIRLCARLPLALSIAAARSVSQPGLSLAALTVELRDAPGRLDALDAGQAAANVRAVLSWSYRQLDPATARLFRLLGLHAGPDVSAAAAASLAGVPLPEARRGLGELTRAHLLTEHAPGRFACHDLLRAYAAELTQSADSEAERHAATGRMLDHYLRTAHCAALRMHPTRRQITLAPPEPGAEPEPIADAAAAQAWFDAELQVLMAAAARALETGFDAQVWQIAWALFRYLEIRGRFHDWMAIEQHALAATQRLGDRSAQALAHQRFGSACGRLANYEDAYAHLDRALSIHTELGDHAGQAYVHNALAIMLDSQGRTSDALEQAQRSLDCYTAAGHANGRAVALNAVGWFCAMLGNYPEALSYATQSLEVSREIGSEDGMAAALDSLGYACQHLGRYAEAIRCYQQALDLHLEISGNWGAAETLGHLGDARYAAGDLAGARADWAESLVILDDLNHPDAAQIRAKLKAFRDS